MDVGGASPCAPSAIIDSRADNASMQPPVKAASYKEGKRFAKLRQCPLLAAAGLGRSFTVCGGRSAGSSRQRPVTRDREPAQPVTPVGRPAPVTDHSGCEATADGGEQQREHADRADGLPGRPIRVLEEADVHPSQLRPTPRHDTQQPPAGTHRHRAPLTAPEPIFVTVQSRARPGRPSRTIRPCPRPAPSPYAASRPPDPQLRSARSSRWRRCTTMASVYHDGVGVPRWRPHG